MNHFPTIRRLLALMARCADYGAAFFLAAMMLVTVADVSSRAAMNRPIAGAYDLVQLFLAGAVFLSLPDVFLRGENIVIDFIDHLVGRRAIDLLKALAHLLAFLFVAALLWYMMPPARDALRFHETSPDMSIPMAVHWALMILGVALALLPAGFMLAGSLVRLFGVRDRP